MLSNEANDDNLILENDGIKILMNCLSKLSNRKCMKVGLEILRKIFMANEETPTDFSIIEWLFTIVSEENDDNILLEAIKFIRRIFEILPHDIEVIEKIDVIIGSSLNKIISLVM